MGKTRDMFKKTGDTKGTFHAQVGMTKDRNSTDLTEAEDIKKRWQECKKKKKGDKNTQKNYRRKIFMIQIITMV